VDFGLNHLDEARKSLHRAAALLEAAPSYAARNHASIEYLAYTLYVLGLVEEKAGNPAEARNAHRRALIVWAASPRPGQLMSKCRAQLAALEAQLDPGQT
jgi:hypothetical protein